MIIRWLQGPSEEREFKVVCEDGVARGSLEGRKEEFHEYEKDWCLPGRLVGG